MARSYAASAGSIRPRRHSPGSRRPPDGRRANLSAVAEQIATGCLIRRRIAEGQPPESVKPDVAIVDLATGQIVARLEFLSGVEEIFDVQVLPGLRWPAVSGPRAAVDGSGAIWYVPDPRPGGSAAAWPSA